MTRCTAFDDDVRRCVTCRVEGKFLFRTGECGSCYCDRRIAQWSVGTSEGTTGSDGGPKTPSGGVVEPLARGSHPAFEKGATS